MVWNRKVFVQVARQISSFAIRMHISELKLKRVVYKAKRISFMWLLAHIFMMIATVLLFNEKQREALRIFRAYTFNLVNSELLQQHKGLLLFVAGVMTFMWNFASMLFVSFHSIACLFLSSIIDTLNKKIGMTKLDEIRELFDILNYVDVMIRWVQGDFPTLQFRSVSASGYMGSGSGQRWTEVANVGPQHFLEKNPVHNGEVLVNHKD
ncbi:hypothetical protein TNCT_665561 [Trichonephila clavata]|uniref:Uncharacterized protein n=1 Tax=Trichonephila clavata TaxID=2740835 RepID=A0A8X6JAH5_TRICU|nr:hypothetical protein TNCT_665561 [Trichonephila clavata]